MEHLRAGSSLQLRVPAGPRELSAWILACPWDLVTTYNWAYNLTYDPPKWVYRGYPNYK